MEFEEYFAQQKSDLKVLEDLDFECKEKNQFIGRYVSIGFTDRICLYVVVDETPKKYLLRFAWGESVHPEWGQEITLSKNKVQQMIIGRDYLETIFPSKK